MTKSKFMLLLAAAMLLLSLCACQKEENEYVPDEAGNVTDTAYPAAEPELEPEPEPEPTCIKVVLPAAMPELSSVGEASAEARMILDLVYQRPLVKINGEYVSDVLTAWERAGGYLWRLSLREGLTDGQGVPFAAEDLARCLDSDQISSINVIDDLHLEVSLASKEAGVMERLLTETYLTKESAAPENGLPDGFGPYQIAETGGDSVLLSRRDGAETLLYEGASPMLSSVPDTILFIFEPDGAARAALAASCGADVIYGLGEEEAEAASDAYASHLILEKECICLFFNMEDSRLAVSKPDIRRAVAAAINPGAFLAADYIGAESGGCILPASINVWEAVAQDMEAAETFVSAAKYRSQELVLIYEPQYAELAQLTAEQCVAVGLNVTVLEVESVADYAAADNADWDMAINTVQGYADAAISYSQCFAANEEGSTWFNFRDENVLYVAGIMGLQSGHDEGNAELFENWLRDSRVVIGLYTPGSLCLTANTAGEAAISDNGVIAGALTPLAEETAE